MANHEVPHISEYLEARITYKKLQQDIHTWERKVRIAQVYFISSDPIREPQSHFYILSYFSWKCCDQTLNSSPLFGSDDLKDKR